jgi:hypothetical protein
MLVLKEMLDAPQEVVESFSSITFLRINSIVDAERNYVSKMVFWPSSPVYSALQSNADRLLKETAHEKI